MIRRIINWLRGGPSARDIRIMRDLQRRNPCAPNLAKLAYYCGCEVEDIINEIHLESKSKESCLYDKV